MHTGGRFLLVLIAVLALSGCGIKKDPRLPQINTPSGVRDLRVAVAGEDILLEWTTAGPERKGEKAAQGFYVYRADEPAATEASEPEPMAAAADAPEDRVRAEVRRRSAAALVVDDAGNEVYAKQASDPMPIASITKLMTAMVLLDGKLPMQEKIAIRKEDRDLIQLTGSRLEFGAALTRREPPARLRPESPRWLPVLWLTATVVVLIAAATLEPGSASSLTNSSLNCAK